MSKDVVAFCMQISINVKVHTEERKRNRGCVFFEEKLEKKKTQAKREKGEKRHKLDVRVVPFGG